MNTVFVQKTTWLKACHINASRILMCFSVTDIMIRLKRRQRKSQILFENSMGIFQNILREGVFEQFPPFVKRKLTTGRHLRGEISHRVCYTLMLRLFQVRSMSFQIVAEVSEQSYEHP